MRHPFFGNQQIPNMGGMSPFQNMQQIMQDIYKLKQNPEYMGQYLYEHKIISKQQLDDLQRQGIAGNPEAIGNNLMQHGAFTQEQAQEAYNTSALPISNSMRQN